MEKKSLPGDKKHRSRYADKVKARKQLARKYNLPSDYTYPQIWAALELMGVKINE